MVFTQKFIIDSFDKFNRMIFKSQLPRIPVKLSRSKSNLGMFCTKYKNMPDGSRVVVSQYFLFSTQFDLEQNELEDVIIHEMIHYLIAFEKVKDSSPHGVAFKSVMNKINKNFGRNITISTRVSSGKVGKGTETYSKWHIIAVLKCTDGKYGIKILPRIAQKAIYYCNSALKSSQIEKIKLFLHRSPFFDKYPTSTVLKLHYVDYETLKRELMGAQKIEYTFISLKCTGKYQGEEIF